MLRDRPYFETFDILGKTVEVEALGGEFLDEYDRLVEEQRKIKAEGGRPNNRIPMAFAFSKTVKRPGGAAVYATADEAAKEDMITWGKLLEAWNKVHLGGAEGNV